MISSPADILAPSQESARFGEREIRKGTIAAFVANAQRFCKVAPATDESRELEAVLAAAIPDLQAIGVLDVFVARDDRVRALIERHSEAGDGSPPADDRTSSRPIHQ